MTSSGLLVFPVGMVGGAFSASHWEGPLPPRAVRSSPPVAGRPRQPRPPRPQKRQQRAHPLRRPNRRPHRLSRPHPATSAPAVTAPAASVAATMREWHRPPGGERRQIALARAECAGCVPHAARALQVGRGRAGQGRQGLDHQGVAAAARRRRTIRTSGGRNSTSASARRWTSRSCRCRSTPRRRRR